MFTSRRECLSCKLGVALSNHLWFTVRLLVVLCEQMDIVVAFLEVPCRRRMKFVLLQRRLDQLFGTLSLNFVLEDPRFKS